MKIDLQELQEMKTMPEVAKILGVRFQRLYYAALVGKVAKPIQVGKTRLFTDGDIERLKRHFGTTAQD
jgi:DNA-binding transcriptional MerR regulator